MMPPKGEEQSPLKQQHRLAVIMLLAACVLGLVAYVVLRDKTPRGVNPDYSEYSLTPAAVNLKLNSAEPVPFVKPGEFKHATYLPCNEPWNQSREGCGDAEGHQYPLDSKRVPCRGST